MGALAANRVTRNREGKTFDFKVDVNKHIYAGGLVMTVAGYLQPGGDTASAEFAGVAGAEVNNNPGLAGAKVCRVLRKGTFLFNKASAVQTDVGKDAYIVDDQTVALVAVTTNDLKCGKIIGIEDSTHVWVAIDNAT